MSGLHGAIARDRRAAEVMPVRLAVVFRTGLIAATAGLVACAQGPDVLPDMVVDELARSVELPPHALAIPPSNEWLRDNSNVILFTWDGVRPEEVFDDPSETLYASGDDPASPLLPHLRGELLERGVLLGNRREGSSVRIANRSRMSLPGYQSIMAGRRLDCEANTCGRIPVETVAERIQRELGLSAAKTATIASWGRVALAAESREGATMVSAGLTATTDPQWTPGLALPLDEWLRPNGAGSFETPPPIPPRTLAAYHGDRPDGWTMDYALQYLRANEPRFLFISLGDADNFAHDGRRRDYLRAIRTYDAYLVLLLDTLARMGDYGRNTTVLVTTDHGRGSNSFLWSFWREHGEFSNADHIWMYGTGPFVRPTAAPVGTPITHRDLRPTIERLFGLCPISCDTCGLPVDVLLGTVTEVPSACLGKTPTSQ